MKKVMLATLVFVGLVGLLFLTGCYGPPSANFSFSPAEPLVGESVRFDGRTSYSPYGGQIVRYDWYKDDQFMATGSVVQHAFDQPGRYRITLRVRDNRQQTDMTTRVVVVRERQLTVGIVFWPHSPAVGQTTTFWGEISYDLKGLGLVPEPNWTFRWEIEGAVYHDPEAQHVFRQSGEHWAYLRVTDPEGRIGEAVKKVLVLPPQPDRAEVRLSRNQGRPGEAIPIVLTATEATTVSIGGDELVTAGLIIEPTGGIFYRSDKLYVIRIETSPLWHVDYEIDHEVGHIIVYAWRMKPGDDQIAVLWFVGYHPTEQEIKLRQVKAFDGRGYPVPVVITQDGRVTVR